MKERAFKESNIEETNEEFLQQISNLFTINTSVTITND